jgi:hypothetical protein
MSTETKAKTATRPRRRQGDDRKAAFERLSADFGPKQGETRGARKRLSAVELLIKLRRGEA